jgi:Putative adhesin
MKNTSSRLILVRTLIAAGLIATGLTMTSCKINLDGPKVTEKTTPDFAGVQTLEVTSFNGDLNITKSENASMTVVKTGKTEVKLERDGDTLRIKAESERNCMNCSADITLEIPQAMNLKLETGNGDVNAKDTLNVQAESGNGNVTLERVTLAAGSENSATSGNGDVAITGLNANDGLEISGSTGNGSSEFKATGYEVQTEDNDFTAKKSGGNPAKFKLESGNGDVTVNP